MLFNDWAKEYFENQKTFVKESTLGIYLTQYRKHIKDYWEDIDLDDISSMKAQQYLNHLVTKPCTNNPTKTISKKAVQDILIIFKAICYEAMRQGIMHEFTFHTKMPKTARESEEQTFKIIKEDDYQRLLKHCVENLNYSTIAILLAIETGMRIGEICGLTWENVDFENNVIKVRQILNRIITEDLKTEIRVGEPKTRTSRRDIPMTDLLKELLKQYKKTKLKTVFDNGKFKNVPVESNKFVISTDRLEYIEPRTLRNAAYKDLKECGIDYIHFHNLRHTFCSYGLKNGIDVKIMSELMGHTKTDITMEIYTHISREQKEIAIKKLNKKIKSD
jgi:integrase